MAGSAAAPPAPTELTLFTLNLTGKVSLVSVKKGRLRTKSAIFDSSLGQKGETTNTQTSVGKQNGLVLFTEIFLNHRPSRIEGSDVDSPPLKPPTIHTGAYFPGRSPLPIGDLPHCGLFSRTVAPSNWGLFTPEAVFPDGRLSKPGTVHTRGRFSGRSSSKIHQPSGIFVYICTEDRLIDQDEDEQKDLPDRNPVVMGRSLPPGPAGG